MRLLLVRLPPALSDLLVRQSGLAAVLLGMGCAIFCGWQRKCRLLGDTKSCLGIEDDAVTLPDSEDVLDSASMPPSAVPHTNCSTTLVVQPARRQRAAAGSEGSMTEHLEVSFACVHVCIACIACMCGWIF